MFWVEFQQLMDSIYLGKHDRRGSHVLVAVMGRFKVDDGNIMHILTLVNVTPSEIRIFM